MFTVFEWEMFWAEVRLMNPYLLAIVAMATIIILFHAFNWFFGD